MDKKVNALMTGLSRRAVEYLAEEVELEASRVEYNLKSVSQLSLKSLTSLIALGGGMEIYLAFSFDESLIRKIFELYTRDLEIEEAEIRMYLEETAGDMINLITGNVLPEISEEGNPITITPPLYINGAKKIGRTDSAKIYMATMFFDDGEMDIICIGPATIFDKNPDTKEH